MACGCGPTAQEDPSPVAAEGQDRENQGIIEMPVVDDDVRSDTLSIQVTFDLQDGTRLLVASRTTNEFEGLRLYHYRSLPDSSAEWLAISSPAYDSWTMFPTFFSLTDRPGTLLILANFGARDSWGQKVLRLDEGGFTDLGFLNVALPERTMDPDDGPFRFRSIAPHCRFEPENGQWLISFEADSVWLYDDLQGGLDLHLAAERVSYLLQQDGTVLRVDGQDRLPADPL
ncbi:MAG: hypothetical protein KDB88_12410 [Flavobacteriales bacterium]|nr:hypothetical protein [Flavobacteriales bacterium]